MKNIIYYWGPVIFLIAFIFILSSFSSLPQPIDIADFDKVEHLSVYLVLSLLFYRALLGTTEFSDKKCIILSILFTVLYGISDELHQFFVHGRDASIADLLFDFLGAILAYGSLFNKVREVIIDDSRMSKL